MADYYTQVSFEIESFPAELDRFMEMYDKLNAKHHNDDLTLGVSATKAKTMQSNDCIWIHDDDGCVDIEALVDLIQIWMQTSEYSHDPVGFEWANTCNKPRLDAFGGGAVMITKGGTRWLHTGQWLLQLATITSSETEKGEVS